MKNFNTALLMLLFLLLFFASLLLAVSFGSAEIALADIIFVVFDGLARGGMHLPESLLPVHDIVWLLRMPRILLAATIGAGLAVCGVVMQAIVKNPLADPYILGVSSGASLGATAAVLLGIGSFLGQNFIGVAAFAGAFVNSLAVVFIANIGSRANSVRLLLAGMALSAVCSAFSSFIVYFANNMEGMQTITYWLMGSMAGASWSVLKVITPLTVAAVCFYSTQSRILNLMLLGDDAAITLGRDLHLYRQAYLLISALVVGFAVYAAGMIGFVGLIVPHAMRLLVGSDHKVLLPASAFCGSVFMVWADVMCRVIIPRSELPIGIFISMIGAPCFIYLMVKRTYGFGGN